MIIDTLGLKTINLSDIPPFGEKPARIPWLLAPGTALKKNIQQPFDTTNRFEHFATLKTGRFYRIATGTKPL
jgi:hypothetical protein